MCLALLYSVFGVVIEKARGAEDDINTIVAGTMTGVLYKSPGRSYIFQTWFSSLKIQRKCNFCWEIMCFLIEKQKNNSKLFLNIKQHFK